MISLIPGRFGSCSVFGICVMGVIRSPGAEDFTLCVISSCWLGMERAPSLCVCPELFCQWVCGFRKLGPQCFYHGCHSGRPQPFGLWSLSLTRLGACFWGSLALLGNIHFWSWWPGSMGCLFLGGREGWDRVVEARVGPLASVFLTLELQACVSMLGTHLGCH